ncbi:MAG: DivIVA domain-containing protein [Gaiellaceae bacterium]
MVDDEPPERGQGENDSLPGAAEQRPSFSELELPLDVPAEIRNVSFPPSVRGYSRPAVDAYVQRVNRLIAELEVRSSPRAAVRHALNRVSEQVGGILERARESAEEITSSAREEAEESSARVKAEAAELVVNASAEADQAKAEAEQLRAKAKAEADELLAHAKAEAEETLARAQAEAAERLQRSEQELAVLREQGEARMRELQADTEAVWEERRELLDDSHGLARRLEELAKAAAARFPPRELAEPAEEGTPAPEAGAEPEPSGVAAMDEPAGAMPALGSHEVGDDQARDEEPQQGAAQTTRPPTGT